ncbi:hypothetical protein [Azospirillum isscasi]|uniref:Uncharacterized protein n=1 Tax=Azospirillum isscasi TaxID=3053926 RepID=A0ABU0WNT2_9PROT|nr:hypothetical protein [Azospirillum isscasi]MDQ2105906.1 hypothetical protein [Azospirillum isscasi]
MTSIGSAFSVTSTVFNAGVAAMAKDGGGERNGFRLTLDENDPNAPKPISTAGLPILRSPPEMIQDWAKLEELARNPPAMTERDIENQRPLVEFWKGGQKVAEVSRGGFLMTQNALDVSSIIARDGALAGRELAEQRAKLLGDMLGKGYEARRVG